MTSNWLSRAQSEEFAPRLPVNFVIFIGRVANARQVQAARFICQSFTGAGFARGFRRLLPAFVDGRLPSTIT